MADSAKDAVNEGASKAKEATATAVDKAAALASNVRDYAEQAGGQL